MLFIHDGLDVKSVIEDVYVYVKYLNERNADGLADYLLTESEDKFSLKTQMESSVAFKTPEVVFSVWLKNNYQSSGLEMFGKPITEWMNLMYNSGFIKGGFRL